MFDGPISKSLPGWPKVTARAVLSHDVEREVANYHDRQQSEHPVWLDLPELQEALKKGEVRFGSRDLSVPAIDSSFACRAAAEAVTDGVVLMFIDERPIKDLDEILQVKIDSRVRYLRLYAQRGF